MRESIVCAFAVVMSGCSFFMVKGPSETQSPSPMVVQQDCTDSMGWPIADGVLSGLWFMSALGTIAAGDDEMSSPYDYEDDNDNESVVASGLVMGSIAAASAYVGYSRVQRCREAKAVSAEQMQRQMQMHGAYAQPYGAYPGQYPAYPQAQPQYAPLPQQYPPAQPQPYPPAQPQPQPYPQPQPQPQPYPEAQPQPPPLVPAQPR